VRKVNYVSPSSSPSPSPRPSPGRGEGEFAPEETVSDRSGLEGHWRYLKGGASP